MKMKIFAVLLLLIAGGFVAVMMFQGRASSKEAYDTAVAAARENAENGIPYMAVQNYKKAFQINGEDEELYREYIEQCKLLGDDNYLDAMKNYVRRFPASAAAYEMLCQYYYDMENYFMVMDIAVEAKEKEVATEKVRDLYIKCSVMFKQIGSNYEEATSFLGKGAVVKFNGHYGFIDENGYYKISPEYDAAMPFLGGSTAVCKDEEWFMINDTGYMVAKPSKKVDYLSFINNGWVLVGINGKYDYMNSSLKVPDNLRFEQATIFKNGVAAVKLPEGWRLINSDLNYVSETVYEDICIDEFNACVNSGIIFAKKKGKWEMLDVSGNTVCDNQFDDVCHFVSEGPAAVKIGEQWGFVSKTGEIVIQPEYEQARSFGANLGAVCKDGLWGYINPSNQMRIEYQFEDCRSFSDNGIALIRDGESWHYIKLYSYLK